MPGPTRPQPQVECWVCTVKCWALRGRASRPRRGRLGRSPECAQVRADGPTCHVSRRWSQEPDAAMPGPTRSQHRAGCSARMAKCWALRDRATRPKRGRLDRSPDCAPAPSSFNPGSTFHVPQRWSHEPDSVMTGPNRPKPCVGCVAWRGKCRALRVRAIRPRRAESHVAPIAAR